MRRAHLVALVALASLAGLAALVPADDDAAQTAAPGHPTVDPAPPTAAPALAGMGFPRRMGLPARRLFTSIAGATWFTPGEGEAWSAEGEDAVGAFQADYTRRGAQVIRTVAAYHALRGPAGLSAQGADQVTPSGQAQFTVDAQGLARAEGELRTVYAMGRGAPRVESRITFRLVRRAARRVPLRAGQWPIAPLSLHVDAGRDRAVADDAVVGDATPAELLTQVDRVVGLDPAHPDTRKWRSVTLRKLASAVRLDPAVAQTVAGDIAAHADDAGRVALLTGALGSAGTPDATDALAGLLDDALPPAAGRQVLNHLALTDAKTPAAAQALQGALDGPEGDLAAAALGAQARGLEGQAPEQVEDVVGALIERFQAAQTPAELRAAVDALGNSGSPRALPYLAGLVAADDRSVAHAAVFALRFIPGAEVDRLLGTLLASGDARALVAVSAVAFRGPAQWAGPLQALRADCADGGPLADAVDRVFAEWAGA